MDINAMRQERARLANQARAILTAAQQAGRDITGEEEATFDRLMAEADAMEARIGREEQLREHERRVAGDNPPTEDQGPGRGDDQAREAAFRAYLTGGRAAMSPEQVRALNMGADPEGGYLVAPQQFVTTLLQRVDDAVPLRGLATVMTITEGESLGVPVLDTDLNDADWTAEVLTGSQDDALRIGKRELRPHPLAKRVKVSRTLLRRAAIDPEGLVQARMAYKFGVTQEKAFMTGDGNQKPLGLFAASAQGISTGRDVQTGSATDMTGDGLIDAKYTLKAAYQRKASWLFHRDAVRKIRKLKDGQQQYVWNAGLAGDRPDTILDLPYVVSEWVPNTFTSGLYVGMLADFSFYWIVDALNMQVQRLNELYAETNQVGFIGRMETDAMPTLEEAFVRLKTN